VTLETRYDDILDAAVGVLARRGFHQASIREIARAADLSLAGLYHYVRGKDELVFLALARALDDLIAELDRALAEARTPELKLLALIRTHLEFAFTRAAEMKIVNRDYDLLPEPRRAEIVARRGQYLTRGIAVLSALDPHGRSEQDLLSSTILLLGMLNGIASRPFLRSRADVGAIAGQVGALFLYGFLERSTTVAAPEMNP
jgi:AcrR family transcriptional regulator